ncbi:MAG TPA: NUDIX hydrolase [candidate division Zixibacteria bacterium]|nr:NUDIX hydrolase [candidate division Zixibacteria bacterium]
MSGFTPNGPSLTVDCVIFKDNSAVLIRRAHDPFKGSYALPGGFVEIGETVEQACVRETEEEIGVTPSNLRFIGIYSDPGRDPRRHTVTVAFLAEAEVSGLKAGSDAAQVELVQDWRNQEIAFDHRKILDDAWKLANRK